jgi:hypothetical protein
MKYGEEEESMPGPIHQALSKAAAAETRTGRERPKEWRRLGMPKSKA